MEKYFRNPMLKPKNNLYCLKIHFIQKNHAKYIYLKIICDLELVQNMNEKNGS